MGYSKITATLIAITTILITGLSFADSHPKTLKVGVKLAPAFVVDEGFKDNYAHFSGEAIDQWVSTYDGISRYTAYPTVDAMLNAVARGDVDVAVGAISVTSEREGVVDFLTPYTQTGLSYGSIANDSILDLFSAVMPTLMKGLAVIFVVNLLAGALFALVEHRANDDVSSTWTSMFVGFYWSSATLTTVGYGDVAAKTALGQVISTIWMWSGLIITAMMMSLVVAATTVESNDNVDFNILESKVAVVEGSAGLHYASKLAPEKHIYTYPTIEKAVASVADGKTDGVIGDKILLDNVAIGYPDVIISNTLLTKDYYAFAVPDEWAHTEELNRRMLMTLEK